MINTSIFLEKFLQNRRFKLVKPYLKGDVLDFGGNQGELKQFTRGEYLAVNYDHSAMDKGQFDTIACLATIEHIQPDKVGLIFKKFKHILKSDGRIFLTTPARSAKIVLEGLAYFGILDKKNIAEHKHYWSRAEIEELADRSGFKVEKYKKFQLGFNQLAILKHKYIL